MSEHALPVHFGSYRIRRHHLAHQFSALCIAVQQATEFLAFDFKPHVEQQRASGRTRQDVGNIFDRFCKGPVRHVGFRFEKIKSLVVIPVQGHAEFLVGRIQQLGNEIQPAVLIGLSAPFLCARAGLTALSNGQRPLIILRTLQGLIAVEIQAENEVHVEIDEARDFIVLILVMNERLSLDIAEGPALIENADDDGCRLCGTTVFPGPTLCVDDNLGGEFSTVASRVEVDAHAYRNSVSVEIHLRPPVVIDIVQQLSFEISEIILLGRGQHIHGDIDGEIDFLGACDRRAAEQRDDRGGKKTHTCYQIVTTHILNKIEKTRRRIKALLLPLFLFLLPLAQLHAGGAVRESGPRSFAMGAGGVALRGDAWSALRNPALLAYLPSQGAVSWIPARYGLNELGSSGLIWVQPIGGVGMSVDVTRFGTSLYREITPAVSTGLLLADGIALGVRAGLFCLSIERYGSTALPLVDLGAAVLVHENMVIAATASNVMQASIRGHIDDRLPAGIRLGAGWTAGENIAIHIEMDKDLRWPLMTRYGVEYRPVDALALRIGATTQPWTVSSGFGLALFGASFDYAYRWHPDLGGSHALGIGFQP
jgi:hypothetical protein